MSQVSREFPVVIATMPANARQRKIALGALIVLAVLISMTLPVANMRLTRVDAFVPVIQAVMCVIALLTSVFLFAQYSVYSNNALLALASGFLSSGLFAFLQALAYPGAYAAAAVIGDGLNSQGWLFVFWHTAFPLTVTIYALSKNRGDVARSGRATGVITGVTITCVAMATAGLAWVATTGVEYLPRLYDTATGRPILSNEVAAFLLLLSATAFLLLFLRRDTILDQWLMVTLLAWLPSFVVAALFTVVRFTVGWYSSRIFALVAGSSLLVALLAETVSLYTRLANAIVLLRREQTDRLAIFNTVADGIVTFDDQGTIENLNSAAARMFGYCPEEVVGRNVKMLAAEPFHREQDSQYLDAWRPTLFGDGREIAGLRRNGTTLPIELAVSETAVAGRRMFVGAMHDITNRKRSAERQATLMAELNHRVKNVLARVAMLAASTVKGNTSFDEYVRSLEGRIQSMAAAHDLLSQSGWQNVGLAPLVRNQLAPYATGSNMTITGDDIMLSAAETQAMAMVLHELVTNSAKYGSLSVPDGQVCVSWDRQKLGSGEKVVFEWREFGGPPVAGSVGSGYGTSLIRDLIPYELGGTVDLVFKPEGVTCKIEIFADVKP